MSAKSTPMCPARSSKVLFPNASGRSITTAGVAPVVEVALLAAAVAVAVHPGCCSPGRRSWSRAVVVAPAVLVPAAPAPAPVSAGVSAPMAATAAVLRPAKVVAPVAAEAPGGLARAIHVPMVLQQPAVQVGTAAAARAVPGAAVAAASTAAVGAVVVAPQVTAAGGVGAEAPVSPGPAAPPQTAATTVTAA